MFLEFPKDFMWGVATAAQQIEGGMTEGGRGLSIWDVFSRIPGKISKGGIPDTACDSFNRLKRDIAMLKELGVNTYRFSFSWPRIIPDGNGPVNQTGIDYYRQLVSLLRENDIIPNATMYHWDLPYALQVQGGFGNREMIGWFKRYAEVLLDTFGEDIPYWVTVNEPIATYVGTAEGFFAPGVADERYARQCLHNLLVCHGETVKLFREKQLNSSKIGIVVDVWKHFPARPGNEADEKMAVYHNEIAGYGMFLHPLFLGGYSEVLLAHMRDKGIVPRIQDDDFDTIRQKLDFYGLNFYNGLFDNAQEQAAKEAQKKEGGNYQDRAQIHTEVLTDVLQMLKKDYHVDIPIILTENGISQIDHSAPDTSAAEKQKLINDTERIDYVKGVLRALHKGMENGADVRGYYLWSLMDNFEWTAGFTERFGLYYTNFHNLECTAKKSAGWYSDVIKRNGFEIGE